MFKGNGQKLLKTTLAYSLSLSLLAPTFSLAENYKILGSTSTYPVNTVTDYVSDELFKGLEDKNKFAEALDIGLDVDLGSDFKLENTYERRVYSLHKSLEELGNTPDTPISGDRQYESQHMLVNNVRSQIVSESEIGDSKLKVNYGIYYAVARAVQPQDVIQNNQQLVENDVKNSLDLDQENIFTKNKDYSELKAQLEKFKITSLLNKVMGLVSYLVSKLEWVIQKVAEPLVDSEEMYTYMEEPLEALKLHIKYGFPINVEIFQAKDNRLQVGDSVKHIKYLGFSPSQKLGGISSVSLGADLISSIVLEKKDNSKVLAEFKIGKSGSFKTTFGKISESLGFGFLKLSFNFLNWYYKNNYKNTVLTYKYEFDLNQKAALSKLKTLVKDRYRLRLPIDSKKETISGQGVKLVSTEYSDSLSNKQFNFLLNLPEIFKFENKKSIGSNLTKIKENGQTHYEFRGGRDHNINTDISLIENVWERDYEADSHMTVEADVIKVGEDQYNLGKDLLVKVPTRYKNDKLKKEDVKRIKKTLQVILQPVLTTNGDDKKIQSFLDEDDSHASLNYAIAFNKDSFKGLLQKVKDPQINQKIWEFFAEMYLGTANKTAWNTNEKRAVWRAWHPNLDQVMQHQNPNNLAYAPLNYNCSSDGPGLFTNKDGIVQPNYFKPLNHDDDKDLCPKFFYWVNGFMGYLEEMANTYLTSDGSNYNYEELMKLVDYDAPTVAIKDINHSQLELDILRKSQQFIGTYTNIQFTPVIQTFLVQYVPNVYIGYDIKLSHKKNGTVQVANDTKNYPQFQLAQLIKTIKDPDDVKTSNPRISYISVSVDTEKSSYNKNVNRNQISNILVRFRTPSPLDLKSVQAKLQFRKFKLTKDTEVGKPIIVDQAQIHEEKSNDSSYRYYISIPWDQKLKKLRTDDTYTMTFVMTNDPSQHNNTYYWITEQKEVLFKMPKTKCFNNSNPSDKECFDTGNWVTELVSGLFGF